MNRTLTVLALAFATASIASADDRPGLLSAPGPLLAPTLSSTLAIGPLSSPNVGDNTFVKIRAGGWYVMGEGTIKVGDQAGSAIAILDFEDTLGQDTDDISAIGSVAVAIPGIDLLVELGFLGNYTFEGSTTETISFNGDEFSGTTTSSEELLIYELNMLYELAEIKYVKLYAGLGVRAVDGTATVTGDVGGVLTTREESAFIPVPVAVAGARLDLGPHFVISGRLGGMYFGDYGSVLDGQLELGYDFFRNFGVFVGYRVMHLESDAFDLEINATLQGPYAGAELRF